LKSIKELQRQGYALQQMIVVHTSESKPMYARGAQPITKMTAPHFFDKLGVKVWEFLDDLREKFNKHQEMTE
jgi:hypothetical protein